MAQSHMVWLLLLSWFNAMKCEVNKFPLLMPDVYPDRDELYLCTPVRIVDRKTFYVVGFEPNATMNVVHHMLLYGCTTPGSNDEVWDCGEMAASQSESRWRRASPCAQGSRILYAWARNAKTLQLPEDVGFQIGAGTEIQYLVLQIHYAKKFSNQVIDNSGLFLMYTEEPQKKLAGVLLLVTGGAIPARSITHMETACQINEMNTIYPFAYRTHTHTLGRVVSGYVVRRSDNGVDHWTLLGKRDPLTAQMFYPVFDESPISYGDKLAARCTMDSTERDRLTVVGSTNNDEMCNFYLMYYTNYNKTLDMKYCMTQGPPLYKWSDEGDLLNNIPEIEASLLA